MYVTQQLHSIDITTTINHVTPSPSLLQFTVTKEFLEWIRNFFVLFIFRLFCFLFFTFRFSDNFSRIFFLWCPLLVKCVMYLLASSVCSTALTQFLFRYPFYAFVFCNAKTTLLASLGIASSFLSMKSNETQL